jgi:ABC-type multidrug transport system fused ATPase/permease subunit
MVMIENGSISEIGTFDELKNKNGPFAEFIKLFLLNNEQNKETIKTMNSINQKESAAAAAAAAESAQLKRRRLSSLKKNESLSNRSRSSLNNSISNSQQQQQQQPDEISEEEEEDEDDDEIHFEKKGLIVGEKIIDKEKISSGTIKLSIIFDYIKKCSIPMTITFLFFFTLSLAALAASNFWLSEWSNDSINSIKAEQNKYYRLTVYLVLGLLQCLLLTLANVFQVLMFLKGARYLHDKLLNSILKSNLHFFESTPIGRIINRFSKDIESTETAIPDSFKICIFCFQNILNTLIIVTYSTPFLLLFLVPIFIVYTFIQRYYVATSRQLARLDSATKSPIFSHFSETLTGVSTIRAYESQQRFVKRMHKNMDDNNIYVLIANYADRWLGLRLDLIGNIITALASLFAVFSRNSLSAGLVGLSISLSLSISQALNFFVSMGANFEANITALERIKEYVDIPQEADWKIEGTNLDPKWPDKGRIRFENYGVKYRAELDYVLKDINTEIEPGEKIGIIGRTGAGKSSLSLGLFRMLENNIGDIYIDNVNVNKIGLHDLRHKLTIIPQDPIIFSGTIKMNLDPFEMYTDAELWTVLELAHLKPLIFEAKEKLDFVCEEGGENLSLGQRQLVCLARALLRKTKILILDEATASVDHNTDELIQNTIRTAFADCTVLTIAHRLNTIMDSSR